MSDLVEDIGRDGDSFAVKINRSMSMKSTRAKTAKSIGKSTKKEPIKPSPIASQNTGINNKPSPSPSNPKNVTTPPKPSTAAGAKTPPKGNIVQEPSATASQKQNNAKPIKK